MKIEKVIVVASISGFYYIYYNKKIIECKAKGIFKKEKFEIVVGDYVDVEKKDDLYLIYKVYDRKNYFIRPKISNIDNLFLVISTVDPTPKYIIIDKIIAVAENKGVDVHLIFTKIDLCDCEHINNIYKNIVKTIIIADYRNNLFVEDIKKICYNKVSAFCGNSGVGKSTLLNFLDKDLNLLTNDISKKLGRGKHTTTTVNLFKIENSGFIADTPGFSTIELSGENFIDKNELQFYFNEFKNFMEDCHFKNCTHIYEKDCNILKNVNLGNISSSRYNSYIDIYNSIKNIKDWNKR